jgi:hypothetical protein
VIDNYPVEELLAKGVDIVIGVVVNLINKNNYE